MKLVDKKKQLVESGIVRQVSPVNTCQFRVNLETQVRLAAGLLNTCLVRAACGARHLRIASSPANRWGGDFLHGHSPNWRALNPLNPLAGSVAPVGPQPIQRFAMVQPGRMASLGDFEHRFNRCPNHNPLPPQAARLQDNSGKAPLRYKAVRRASESCNNAKTGCSRLRGRRGQPKKVSAGVISSNQPHHQMNLITDDEDKKDFLNHYRVNSKLL